MINTVGLTTLMLARRPLNLYQFVVVCELEQRGPKAETQLWLIRFGLTQLVSRALSARKMVDLYCTPSMPSKAE